MGFRLRHGLNALGTLGVLVACNTYTPDLLVPADTETTSDNSETSDSTLTTGAGGSSNIVTTTINTVTSTSASTGGGDGGSGPTTSGNDTTGGGGSGGDSSTGSTSTETETTSTSTSATGDNGGSSGSGGSDSTGGGGSGGSGGNTTGTIVNPLLIDDLEDGNNQLETPTYSGYWFTTANEDGDGTVAPDPDDECDPEELVTPRDGSTHAMHVSGSWTGTDLEWIAAFGFPLKHDEVPVDASSYAGVTFYAKTDNEDTAARLQVMITDVEDEGHFAIELGLTSSWEQYTVRWDNQLLMQPTWADQVTFDPANLFKLQFQFDSDSFDLWVDDISFIE